MPPTRVIVRFTGELSAIEALGFRTSSVHWKVRVDRGCTVRRWKPGFQDVRRAEIESVR